MSIFGIESRDFKTLLVFYLIAHGGILLISNAIYWDDWTLWNNDPEHIFETFRQAGSFLNMVSYLHNGMLAVGPWLYKALTFLIIFVTGLIYYRLLQMQPWVASGERLLIVLLYLVTPLYAARVALIDFPYTLCLLFFFLGWLFIKKSRGFSLFFFILSFNTQSFLVFYLLPMLDWYFRENKNLRPPVLLKWGIAHLDYILLPVLWFFIKTIFFKPTGSYDGYNEHYGLLNLVKAPFLQALDFANFQLPVWLLSVALVVGTVTMKLFVVDQDSLVATPRRKIYFLVAVLALWAALFPYWVLGHVPTFNEWTSRHQLLMPVGVSLLLVGILSYCGGRARSVVLSFVLAVSLAANWNNYFRLFWDWQKQKEIIAFLHASHDVASAQLVVFEDSTSNAFSRVYRFYEWNGLLKIAYGETHHKFGINVSQMKPYMAGEYDKRFSAQYNGEGHRRRIDQQVVKVTIDGSLFAHRFSTGKLNLAVDSIP